MSSKDDSKLAEIIDIFSQLSEENQRIFIDELHKIADGEQKKDISTENTHQKNLFQKKKKKNRCWIQKN